MSKGTMRKHMLKVPDPVRQLISDYAWGIWREATEEGESVKIVVHMLHCGRHEVHPLTPLIDVIANEFADMWNHCEGGAL